MLTIRLTRKGKKNQPFFRVVLIDKRRSTKGGRAVEDLGYVDPLKKRKSFKKERIQYWISKGAQTSATIHNLLVSEKIIEGKKIHVSRLSKKAVAKVAEAKKSAVPKLAEGEPGSRPQSGLGTPVEVEKPAEPAQSPSDNEADKKAKPEEIKEEAVSVETPKDLPAPEEQKDLPTPEEETKTEPIQSSADIKAGEEPKPAEEQKPAE